MAKRKTDTAPAPLPPAVRVAVHPPGEDQPEQMCTLADRCLAGAAANPNTIGTSPFLPPLTTANTATKALIPSGVGGSPAQKTSLRASTRKLKGFIMGHAGWVDSQIVGLTPADATAYATAAGFTTAKAITHAAITAMDVTNGPPGSALLVCEFPDPPGRCLSCTEYSTDGQKTWTRGDDTEKSHVNMPLVFTPGQKVDVRMRQFLRGSGYTPWVTVSIVVI
jgi:hypothetical protein